MYAQSNRESKAKWRQKEDPNHVNFCRGPLLMIPCRESYCLKQVSIAACNSLSNARTYHYQMAITANIQRNHCTCITKHGQQCQYDNAVRHLYSTLRQSFDEEERNKKCKKQRNKTTKHSVRTIIYKQYDNHSLKSWHLSLCCDSKENRMTDSKEISQQLKEVLT